MHKIHTENASKGHSAGIGTHEARTENASTEENASKVTHQRQNNQRCHASLEFQDYHASQTSGEEGKRQKSFTG